METSVQGSNKGLCTIGILDTLFLGNPKFIIVIRLYDIIIRSYNAILNDLVLISMGQLTIMLNWYPGRIPILLKIFPSR